MDVCLEGVVPTSERSGIINDLVKYLLYERGQIPMTYDQLKDVISVETKKICENDKCKSRSVNCQEVFLQDIEALFSAVNYVFTNIVPVRKILVIFGPSIISPKESFMINFPTEFYEGTIISHKCCMRKVFRQLIAKNFLDNTKSPNSGTSLFLLFWAPRNCNYEAARLLPKLSFNAPNRGLRFLINFTFSHVVKRSPNISLTTDDKVDISGIELLDDSLGDGPSDSRTASSPLHKSTSVADTPSCLENSDQTESDDFIWYQSSTVVKGFKEKFNDDNKIWKLS